MILQRMTKTELDCIGSLVEWQVPLITKKTGISSKLVSDVLLVSTFLLTKERGLTVTPLDDYVHAHCHRFASDLGVSYFDVQQIFTAQVELLVTTVPAKNAGREAVT